MRSRSRWCGLTAVVFLGWFTLPSHALAQSYDTAMDAAMQARAAGDFAGAERRFRDALEVRPDDIEARRLLALMVAFQDRTDEALDIIVVAAAAAPDNIDVMLSHARILGFLGRYGEAEELTGVIVERVPDYADAWALRGRLAYYQQDYGRSRESFERAQELAPNDLESLLGLGDVALATGNRDAARGYYDQAVASYPDSPDALDRVAALERGSVLGPAWRLDIEGELSALSRTALSDWSEQSVRLERRLSAATQVFGRLSRYDRFDLEDWMIDAGFATRVSDGFAFYGEAGLGLGVQFQPDWQIAGGVTQRVWRQVGALDAGVVTVDNRVRHYDVGTITSFDIGWQQYFGGGRFWLWGKVLNTIDADDKHLTGWSVTAFAQLSDDLRLRLATALAPESDRGIVVDTRSYAGGLEYDLSETVLFRVTLSHDARENSYRRFSVRSGFSFAF